MALPWIGRGVPDAEVPFDFIHNQVVLRAQINGQGPYMLLLDTGTYASSIDAAVARRLRLPLSAARTENAGAGSRRTFGLPCTVGELGIGGLHIRALPAVVVDLSAISRAMGRPVGGVLGSSFLNSRITQIDYFHRRIRFFSTSPFETPHPPDTPRRIAFPVQFLSGSTLPILEDCTVNGTRLPVTVDTGSSLGLILFPDTIRRLGLESLAKEGAPLGASGYRGKARLTKGWVRSLALRSIELGAVEVGYVLSGYGDDEEADRRGGNLGNAVLQDFVLTLDYSNRVVVLESTVE